MHHLNNTQSEALVLVYETLHNKALTKKELGKAIGWSWPTLTKYVNRFEFLRCLEWDEGCLVLGDKAILYYRKAKKVEDVRKAVDRAPAPEKQDRRPDWGRRGI